MAFSFQQQSNRSWFSTIFISLLIVALAGGVYMLFFSRAPLIEVVVPPEVGRVTDLSQVDLSTADFSSDPVFNTLQTHVSEAAPGPAGRANPFAPF